MRALAIAVLLLAGCGKKAGSDCDAAVDRGVDQTIAKRRGSNAQPLTPAEQELPPKLKAALKKSCVDEKWSADVIECFKTAEDIGTCKGKLTAEQRAAYTRAAMGVMMNGAGGGPGGTMPPHGMTPPAGGDAVLPQECTDYQAAMAKIAGCAPLPQQQRDAMKQAFDQMATAWKDFGGMPEEAKRSLAQGCKAAVDSLKAAAVNCGL